MFYGCLSFKMEAGKCVALGGRAFVSKGNAIDPFQIPPENIDYRHEENNYEKLQGK